MATIPERIIELAKRGEVDDAPGQFAARYSSLQPGITWVLARLMRESSGKCGAVFEYYDTTSYYITWDEGQVWSLTHIDIADEDRPDFVLPFTKGLLRATYVSRRVATVAEQAREVLNVQEMVAGAAPRTGSAPDEAVLLAADGLHAVHAGLPEQPSIARAFLDIDPADVDITALCNPIWQINPDTDQLPMKLQS